MGGILSLSGGVGVLGAARDSSQGCVFWSFLREVDEMMGE